MSISSYILANASDSRSDAAVAHQPGVTAPPTPADCAVRAAAHGQSSAPLRAQLEETTAWLTAIVETAIDAIIVIDSRGRIESFNPAAERMFGFSASDVIGRNINMLMPPAYASRHDEYLRRYQQTGQRHIIGIGREVMGLRKDGTSIPLDLAVAEMRIGTQRKFTGILRDLSERRHAEAALADYARALEQLSVEAEVANRAKSEFLANTSHELRTPLTSIIGFAEAMCDEALRDEERASFAQIIRRNAEHLLAVINDILDISKIEAGRLVVECAQTSLCALLEDVCGMLSARAEAKGVKLRVEREASLPETTYADPLRLRQILLNLVSNAVKFTDCGSVTIHASLFHADRPMLRFDVIDTGMGIAREHQSRLFLPFSQADSSMARRYGGNGLGLSICRRLANMMGGEVTLVRTAPDKGSVFRLEIPAAKPAGAADASGSSAAPGSAHAPPLGAHKFPEQSVGRADDGLAAATAAQRAPEPRPSLIGLRVLVAEDGIDTQRLIRRILERAGATVLVVENGRQALDAVRDVGGGPPFDVVLMDMQMPLMDGYDAARALRREGYARPIIALTAHAMSGDREKCLRAGCNEFATKPIVQSDLVRLVAQFGRPPPATPA